MARNYGLPTRILDWSTNPLKALFFAVENISLEDDGVVWAFQPKSTTDTLQKLKDIDSLKIYYPDQINPRLIAQESCYSFHPFPDKKQKINPINDTEILKDNIEVLIRILIPFSSKPSIKAELNKVGTNYRSMFPDLEGLSKQIVWELGL